VSGRGRRCSLARPREPQPGPSRGVSHPGDAIDPQLSHTSPTCEAWLHSLGNMPAPPTPLTTPGPALTPSQKGAVAEAALTAAAIEMGLTVLRPLCEGRRYDLVIDLEPRLLRVQCKLARHVAGAISVHAQTNRYTPAGYVSTSYSASEIDAIAAYSIALRRCFLIPIAEASGRRALHLRLDRARNNQARGIRWASDFEFAIMIERLRRVGAADDLPEATLSKLDSGL
jgi:PD-(D/E)XK endonuclease